MPTDLSMKASIYDSAARSGRMRSLLIGLGLLCAGIGAVVLSLYLWTEFQRVPPLNWLLAVLCSLATVGMGVALIDARAPFREACPVIALGASAVVIGFFWGFLGLVALNLALGIAVRSNPRLRRP